MAAITWAKDILLNVQMTTGGQPFSLEFPEGALQTYKRGWLVDLDPATGTVIGITSDTPTRILGMATADAHNDAVAGTHVAEIVLAHPSNVFAANVLGASLADIVLTQSFIGSLMGIQRDTVNNRIFLNASVQGGPNVRVWTQAIAQNQPSTPTTGFGPVTVGTDLDVRVTFQFIEKFTWTSSS